MDRLVSISRAAKLVGVSRGNLQRKIQDGELESFEGQLRLSDLAERYPDVQLEDNSMLEKLERIIENAAVRARNRTRPLPPDMEQLAARVNLLTEDLIEARLEISIFYNIIDKLKSRIHNLSHENPKLQDKLEQLQGWLVQEIDTMNEKKTKQFPLLATDTFLRLVAAQVHIEQTGHEFFVEGSNSILESGLSAGLAMNYGCSNGNCGKCKAKLLSGEIKKIRPHDYVLTESDKLQGYFLACSNTAVTDIVISADEAGSEQDIPLQSIQARIRKLEFLNEDFCIMNVITPRTQRLRFLAGQQVRLEIAGSLVRNHYVASCPCEDMHLQFHIRRNRQDAFAEYVFSQLKQNDVVSIEGPAGHFVLHEDETSPIVFIAFEEGFAPIKSLIEHAMTLDATEHIYLYWVVNQERDLYQQNQCRAWADVFERFEYNPLVLQDTDSAALTDKLLSTLPHSDSGLSPCIFYIAGPDAAVQASRKLLLGHGVKPENLYCDSTPA